MGVSLSLSPRCPILLLQWRQADTIRYLGILMLAKEQDYTGLIVGCVCVSLLLLLLGALLLWRRNKRIDGKGRSQRLEPLSLSYHRSCLPAGLKIKFSLSPSLSVTFFLSVHFLQSPDPPEVWYDSRGHIQHLDRLANARSISPTNELVSHESVDYRTNLLEGTSTAPPPVNATLL